MAKALPQAPVASPSAMPRYLPDQPDQGPGQGSPRVSLDSDSHTARDLYFSTGFLLYSIDAWEHDRDQRYYDLAALTDSFHQSVPVLDFPDYAPTVVPGGT